LISNSIKLSLNNIDAIVIDFDGVLTDNSVYVDQNGKESVRCSRSDGLAFDVLKKINKPAFILSTEINPVVTARANKLKIKAYQGSADKVKGLTILADKEGIELNKILYIGNDVNDYNAMQLCGFSVCPSDSHELILKNSDLVLRSKGGNGVIRELLEDCLSLDFLEILYN
jgi:3-deoxy-D-manno-octulosonate 8-phosphate phosphatase (KDO 8-P phosphatase)